MSPIPDDTPKSVNRVPIRLTEERWSHIVSRHPELERHRNRLFETISNPDFVAKGFHGELKAAKLYVDFPMGPRYLIVMYREISPDDGVIITARISSDVGNTIRSGIVWQRK
jgi:hypothetical protein